VLRSIFLCAAVIVVSAAGSSEIRAQSAQPLTETQRQTFERSAAELQASLDQLSGRTPAAWVDAAIFAKGLAWALRYDREFTPGDIRLLEKAIRRTRERLTAPASESPPGGPRRGKLALGYLSSVDGSVQPYGLIVPRHYHAGQPMRLDVVLHGSTRPVGMAELRFIARFDEGDGASASPPDQPYIELHPLGRVENCYRWSGETDVLEAIEDVCRRYQIDRDRIVLRGMSMGASGTWHLGLKHPDRFIALGPYCGYVDTHRFSETPMPNFVKVGPLPDHQELGLHLLDSQDYAANAGVVPAIACMGEKDPFFQAHVLMGEAMRREGLTMTNLISPGTGHAIDPVTHAEQLRRIGEHVAAAPRRPRELRFVTWTLKYNRCHWLEVLQLERHYARAEVSARLADDVLIVDEPRNITRFAIVNAQLPSSPATLRIGAADLPFPRPVPATDGRIVLARRDGQWRIEPATAGARHRGKRPGLQGPIDDAFTTPFLCVRGTGQPWNVAVQAYADASLRRFAHEWHHYFRGELPIKNDVDVTPADVQGRNLILFGDPGSNSWIANVLPYLPLTWSKESLRLGGQRLASSEHFPALIAPNPLPGAGEHYVVLNSGHTFRESELAKLNYLLFPRWGDWAILKIDSARSATEPLEDHVLQAGYFDEQWQLPVAPRNPGDLKKN
jgi:pimeloyl-ACP methyl ester carboxylesterase